MELLIIKLLEYLRENKEQSSSVLVAKTLMNNLEKISKMSLEEASQFCHCSPSTLNRLIKKIGFENFKQLRKIINLPKLVYPTYGFVESDYKQHIFDNIDEVSKIDVSETVELIHNARRIVILSFATNYPFVTEFQVKMIMKHKYIETMFDYDMKEVLKNLTRSDLIIVISDQGNFTMNMNLSKVKCQKILLTQTVSETNSIFDKVVKLGSYGYYGESKYSLIYFLDKIYESF